MAELVADCPRCGSKRITFDLRGDAIVGTKHNWQRWYEAFCVCRHCHKATIWVLADESIDSAKTISQHGLTKYPRSVSELVRVVDFISLKDAAAINPPEHLPDSINASFSEGAKCFAVGCNNAAATMFRLCIDLATRSMLPAEDEKGLNAKIRRDLGPRLPWLFDNGILPEALRELSSCVREDGNEGAHAGTLSQQDAEDVLDFTNALLERLFTEQARLRLAKDRRAARRA